MGPQPAFPERFQGIIARYLRGEAQFDSAADEIAGILGPLMKAAPEAEPRQPGVPIKIRPLTMEELTNPRVIDVPTGGVLHAVHLAPSWNSEEKGKVRSLMEEVVRRIKSAGGAV